jgi:hypothetical protein
MYLRHLQLARMLSPEGEGSGGTTPPVTPPALEPATFSVDYVRELRAENKGYRLKATELERTAADAQAKLDKAASDLETEKKRLETEHTAKVTEVQAAAAARLIRAEIKAGALDAGLKHNDFLKLIDTSAIKIGDDGEVVVPADFWAGVKAKSPHFFNESGAEAGTTSQTRPAPRPAAPGAVKKAVEMTDAEFNIAMGQIEKTGRVPA